MTGEPDAATVTDAMTVEGRLTRALTDYSRDGSLGSRFRRRRAEQLRAMLSELHGKGRTVEVVDLGGTRQYWRTIGDEALAALDVRVTLVNLDPAALQDEGGRFRCVEADACDLRTIEDDRYDLAHANSVIEHVGDWTRMQAFAGEASRIGRRLYVQTPNFWFPVEPHFGLPFFHWLPEPTRARILMLTDIGHGHRSPDISHATFRAQSARLLTRRQMAALFPDATIAAETIGPFTKSLIATR